MVFLGTNVLCGSGPEGHVTVTTLYIDNDFALDQFFWQYSGMVTDRFYAQELAETLYTDPAQILHRGQRRTGPPARRNRFAQCRGTLHRPFHRMQALWFAVADVFTLFIQITGARQSPIQRGRN